jgi:hypothetical protein
VARYTARRERPLACLLMSVGVRRTITEILIAAARGGGETLRRGLESWSASPARLRKLRFGVRECARSSAGRRTRQRQPSPPPRAYARSARIASLVPGREKIGKRCVCQGGRLDVDEPRRRAVGSASRRYDACPYAAAEEEREDEARCAGPGGRSEVTPGRSSDRGTEDPGSGAACPWGCKIAGIAGIPLEIQPATGQCGGQVLVASVARVMLFPSCGEVYSS